MDAAGIRWFILSGFRDDYRQTIASGLKAGASNSLHGGKARTGGCGHGQAVDITSAEVTLQRSGAGSMPTAANTDYTALCRTMNTVTCSPEAPGTSSRRVCVRAARAWQRKRATGEASA